MQSILTAFVLLAASSIAFASGEAGHHGGITDLIPPLFNVVVLGSFLVWKLKKPMSDHFTTKAEEISNTLERASLKSKEAEVMLQAQEKKLQNVDGEIKEIFRQTDQQVKTFEKNYIREIEEKSFKLKSDATAKIDAERKQMLAALNSTILDEVIKRAKGTIKGSRDLQSKATDRIMGEIVK